MSPLWVFRILLYRNNSTAERAANITLLSLECSEYESKSWLSHSWVHWACPWHGLSWFCASQDDKSFFCRVANPLQRRKICVRTVQCLNSSYSLLSRDTSCFLSEAPTPRTEDWENKKNYYKSMLRAHITGGYTSWPWPAPAPGSSLCNLWGSTGPAPACRERSHTARNHGFDKKLLHPVLFLINCCFLLYSKCHLLCHESKSLSGQMQPSAFLEKVWPKRRSKCNTWYVKQRVRGEGLEGPRVGK